MSGFLLDTNVPSDLVRPQPEPKVKTWVAAQDLVTLFMSSVSFGELRKGIVLRSPGKRRAKLEDSKYSQHKSCGFGRVHALRWSVLG